MTKRLDRCSARLNFGIALEAVKGVVTINQMVGENYAHPHSDRLGKKQLHEESPAVFRGAALRQQRAQEAALGEQIGRLRMELEWPSKGCPLQLRPSAQSLKRDTPISTSEARVNSLD